MKDYITWKQKTTLMKPNLIIVTLSEETCQQPIRYKNEDLGSSCGSVGRAVASATRGPRFEFSYQQNKL